LSPAAGPALDLPLGKANVRDFELYIDDDRYRTPTLIFVHMSDEHRVRQFAKAKLDEDKRHRGIEVRENGVRLFGLGTLADLPGSAPHSDCRFDHPSAES
jgi:hypothetical protein